MNKWNSSILKSVGVLDTPCLTVFYVHTLAGENKGLGLYLIYLNEMKRIHLVIQNQFYRFNSIYMLLCYFKFK